MSRACAPLLAAALGSCALYSGGRGESGPIDGDSGAADSMSIDDAQAPADAPLSSDAALIGDTAAPAPTCKELLSRGSTQSGTYSVRPQSVAISVYCDMTTSGGGWTLVGLELAGSTGTFRFLDADTNNDKALAAGTANGLIGKRFIGKYVGVLMKWGSDSLQFTRASSFDLFANTVNSAVALTNFQTSDSNLDGWVSNAGGAVLCVASRDNDIRPGDTSWAITPKDDNNRFCGCDSGGWIGRGAYYGGTVNGQQTACLGFGGGWAGAKDNGVQKGSITPNYETRLFVR